MCIVLIHVYDSQHTRSFHFPVHFFYEYGDFTLTNEIDILNARQVHFSILLVVTIHYLHLW